MAGTTERALTEDLSEDFSRNVCYFFVRPKKRFLEVCIILGRAIKAPQLRRVETKTNIKFGNILRITQRDEVEPPITDWLREAYELPEKLKRTKRAVKTSKKR